jgi:hypothetical protein
VSLRNSRTCSGAGGMPKREWGFSFIQLSTISHPSSYFTSNSALFAKMAESTPRASDHNSHYPHPSLSLPHPTLSLDFRMSVTLNPRISVGPTPLGHRNWISFTGGTWSGSWGSGIVLVGRFNYCICHLLT